MEVWLGLVLKSFYQIPLTQCNIYHGPKGSLLYFRKHFKVSVYSSNFQYPDRNEFMIMADLEVTELLESAFR